MVKTTGTFQKIWKTLFRLQRNHTTIARCFIQNISDITFETYYRLLAENAVRHAVTRRDKQECELRRDFVLKPRRRAL